MSPSTDALLAALARAAPLCLVLPLPGLWPRVTLGFVLAFAAGGVPGLASATWLVEAGRGLALGFFVAAPLWAARWAGRVLGGVVEQRGSAIELTASVLGWGVFLAAGGAQGLIEAYLGSYTRWPAGAAQGTAATSTLAGVGGETFLLAARLALPALLVLALVELGAGLLARFEASARYEAGAQALGRGARPVVAIVLLVASFGVFVAGIGEVVHGARAAEHRPSP